MKTLVKIIFTLLLIVCLNTQLHAQVESHYVVKYEAFPVDIRTEGWICGRSRGSTTMTVVVNGNNVELAHNKNYLFNIVPEKFRFTGKLTIDSDDPLDFQPQEGAYTKGMAPFTLNIYEFFDTGCERTVYAKGKITVDDPVDVTSDSSKSGGSTFASATEKLTLRVGNFYNNGKAPVLQISIDNQKTWIDIRSVSPNEVISLSYDDIVSSLQKKTNISFEELFGQRLRFRVLKTLLDNTQTFGKFVGGGVVFYPDGMKFSITNTKRTYCDEDVTLTVHMDNPDDAKYMTLAPDRFHWVMARVLNESVTSGGTITTTYNCEMDSLGGNKFRIIPQWEFDGKSLQSPFIEEPNEVKWKLQLQEREKQDIYYSVREFTIPARPKEITVKQMPPTYSIGSGTYHVPHRNSKFVMLNIADSSYESHHRLPYTVILNDSTKVRIHELGVSDFKDLTQVKQDSLRNAFNIKYDETDYTTARKNFADAQQGIVLPEKVERIAMSKDSSFFLYTQKDSDNAYRLHKATFTSGKNINNTLLIPSENVIDMEVTPDGAYCVYKKYNTAGIFILPLTGAIPASGTLLSNKSNATTVSSFGEELPNHIYKTASGGWAVVSLHNASIYSITIPGGAETAIMAAPASISNSSQLFVTGDGDLVYYELWEHGYSIVKTNLKNIPLSSVVFNTYTAPSRWVQKSFERDDFMICSADVSYPWESPYPENNPYPEDIPDEGELGSDCVINTSEELLKCYKEKISCEGRYMYHSRCSSPSGYYVDYDSSGKSIIVECSKALQYDIGKCDYACYNHKYEYERKYYPVGTIRILDVALDGSEVIISHVVNNVTHYYKMVSGQEETLSSGTNFKINPVTQDIIFSRNGNTYKSNIAEEDSLISNRKSTNICFSGNGRYFLFVEPVTGHVYKQYMSDDDALEDTEPLFRESQRQQFLNERLGTKVFAPDIECDTTYTWRLKDADECEYGTFEVKITAPENPSMSYTIDSNPTSICAKDGIATITYEGGGAAPFLYKSDALQNIGDKITIGGLGYGDTEIQFTNAVGNKSYAQTIKIGTAIGITDVKVTRHQTCESPDGRILVTVDGFSSGEKTYRLTHQVYASPSYTHSTASNSYEFTGIPAGMYEVSVSQGGCTFNKMDVEVKLDIFKISGTTVTDVFTLKGKGSATVTFDNLKGTATWQPGSTALFDSPTVTRETVTTRNGGIEPGTYALTIKSSTDCMVNTSMTIEKPSYSGKIIFHYTKDSLRLFTDSHILGNKWFLPYQFRIVNAAGEIITESTGGDKNKRLNAVIRQAGTYGLYARHTQGHDSLLLHAFKFPEDTIRAKVDIAPPVCPQGEGTATVNVQAGGFSTKTSSVRISMDGLNYDQSREFKLGASVYNAFLRDTLVESIENLHIHSILTQPFSFTIPAVEPVSAQVDYASPLCAGSSDGWIRLSDFTGGSGDYAYNLNNGDWQEATVTTKGLAPGTYNVFLRDNTHQCAEQTLQQVILRAPAALSVGIITVAHTTCELDNGVLAAKASGGMPPYTYTIRSTSSSYTAEQEATTDTVSFTGLRGGQQYAIVVKDAHGCIATATRQAINDYTNPSITGIDITDVSCYGENSGRVAASLAQGTSPIDSAVLYTEDDLFRQHNGSGVFGQLPAGVYKIDVYDRKGCKSKDAVPVSVNEPAAALTAVNNHITDVLCNGKATGILEYTVSGGTAPYKINITGAVMREQSSASTLFTFTGLLAGTYTAKVSDKNNCTYTVANATIHQPPQLELSFISATHTTCELNNGIIAVHASGGVAPYTYKLSTLAGAYSHTQQLSSMDTAYFSHLAGALDYQLEITDSHGCVISCEERIHGYKNPSISAATFTDVSCFGENNGKVELSLMPGDAPVRRVKLYTPDDSFEQNNLSGIFEGLLPGNYRAEAYDEKGCKSNVPYPVSIKEPKLLGVVVDTILPVIAKGARSGKINFKVQGGNAGNKTIELQSRGVIADQLSGISNVPLSFTQYAGTYVLQVTDAKGCRFITDALQIEEPADSLRLTLKEVRDALCKSQVGSITVEGIGGWGGYRYQRAADRSFAALNTFDKLYPGNYVITVIDRLGGTYSETITIHEPKDSLRAVITAQELPTCGDNGALSINITGGTPPYKLYEHTDTTFYTHPQAVHLTNKGSGHYLWHLVDNNGCRFELESHLSAAALLTMEELTIQHPSLPAATDGSVAASVHGGTEPYTYRWTQDITMPLPVNAPALTGIPAGYYGVEVSDAKGCTVQAEAMLSNPSDVSFTLVDLGHETSFGAADGYAILYADVPLSDYELITPAPAKHAYTNADSTAIFHTRSDTVFLHGLSGGKWILSGRNAEGQQGVLALVIHPYQAFSIANVAVMHARRPGDANGQARIDVLGGGGGNLFTWKKLHPAFPEDAWTDTQILSEEYSALLHDVPAGLYAVQVADRYGNILQREISIEEPEQALAASIGSYQNQSCKTYQDAYAILSANGGWGDYQFRHSSEQYFSNSAIFQQLGTGEHSFYIIDRYGVMDSVHIRISEPDYLRTSVASIDSITCKNAADGRLLFNLSGGTAPYRLSELNSQIWMNGTVAANIPEGYHTFVFTDNNACVGLDTLTVYLPEPDSLLFKDITVVHTTCGEDNGKITVSMQGGTLPYDYRWEDFNGAVTGNDTLIAGLQKNALYHLTVTDRNGCVRQLTQQINSSSLPAITGLQTTAVLCYGDTTGAALITAIVPATPYAPYDIVWSNTDKGHFSGKFPAGTHSVTLTDANGCVATRYFTISQPDPLTITAAQIKAPDCYGFSDGYIHTRSDGGVGGYTYEWSTGAVTPDADHLAKGDYHVKLTDANGCTTTQAFTVSQPDTVTLVVSGIKTPDCYGYTNGFIVTEGQGGVGGYKYNWSTGATTSGISGLAAGAYHLALQDANGCTIDSTFILSQPDILALTATGIKEPSCYGFNDGYILTEGQGGTGDYKYNWSTGATTPDIKELAKGNYSVVFSDANGCSLIRYFDIAQPDLLQLAATDLRDPHCFGYSDGHILTETTGGVRAYTYQWSTGAATPHIENLAKGNYHVLLRDANGCTYQKSFTLEEPAYQSVDLGEDVMMCPGNTHLLDGGNYTAYRWYTAGGDIFNERYLRVTAEGMYFLEATDTRGCPAWGEVSVAIGDNALTADFLLPSEAPLGDTIIAIELSNLPLDSLRWNYHQQIFERLWPDNDYNQPYILHLRSLQTGIYNVTLYAYTGGCYAYATKQIEIIEPMDSGTQPAWGYHQEPLITSLELYPNPTGGFFNVAITLRETADITLTLFEVASGAPASIRTERGMNYYYLTYDIPQLNSGFYALIVTAGKERKQVTIVVEK